MKFTTSILLASGSPRRKSLLSEMGIPFEVKTKDIDENYPDHLRKEEVAIYVATKKANAYSDEIAQGYTVITADTIVCFKDLILGKPSDNEDAFNMLRMLSGNRHEVITAVCIKSLQYNETFHVLTTVHFNELTDSEINYYIEHHHPFDKAGAYGIQDWIGLIAIDRIEGSYHNVVGLPVCELYQHLLKLNSFSQL